VDTRQGNEEVSGLILKNLLIPSEVTNNIGEDGTDKQNQGYKLVAKNDYNKNPNPFDSLS
jgi:hypothetical protein